MHQRKSLKPCSWWSENAQAIIGAILLTIMSGCIPQRYHEYRASAPGSSVPYSSGYGINALWLRLPGKVTIYVSAPSHPGPGETIRLGIEIPQGHSLQLTQDSVILTASNETESWRAALVDSGGFRYLNGDSGERSSEHGAPNRLLVGSTWNTHRLGEKEYSIYDVSIVTDRPYPPSFSLHLPSALVDGTAIMLPTVNFQFGAHAEMRALSR
jgi:hypothetical protein